MNCFVFHLLFFCLKIWIAPPHQIAICQDARLEGFRTAQSTLPATATLEVFSFSFRHLQRPLIINHFLFSLFAELHQCPTQVYKLPNYARNMREFLKLSFLSKLFLQHNTNGLSLCSVSLNEFQLTLLNPKAFIVLLRQNKFSFNVTYAVIKYSACNTRSQVSRRSITD